MNKIKPIIDKRWSIYDTDSGRNYKIFPDRKIARENVVKDKRWFTGDIGIRSMAKVCKR